MKDETGGGVIAAIRDELAGAADQKAKESAQRFFKEDVAVYGVKTAAVRAIARRHFREIKGLSKPEIFALCRKLLASDFMEEAFIAFEWSYALRQSYQPADFQVFEGWLREFANNWAKCDTLCNHTIGTFIEQYPEYLESLKSWAGSRNRWMRRASAVSLILPARKGRFLPEIFEIADMLLEDRDDMVQKGYGWMLKEASKPHQQEVFDYVMARKGKMPRTALRYAIEKMPAEMRKKAMEK